MFRENKHLKYDKSYFFVPKTNAPNYHHRMRLRWLTKQRRWSSSLFCRFTSPPVNDNENLKTFLFISQFHLNHVNGTVYSASLSLYSKFSQNALTCFLYHFVEHSSRQFPTHNSPEILLFRLHFLPSFLHRHIRFLLPRYDSFFIFSGVSVSIRNRIVYLFVLFFLLQIWIMNSEQKNMMWL